jgi:hypothetical protein
MVVNNQNTSNTNFYKTENSSNNVTMLPEMSTNEDKDMVNGKVHENKQSHHIRKLSKFN